jgi:hypothetical protein
MSGRRYPNADSDPAVVLELANRSAIFLGEANVSQQEQQRYFEVDGGDGPRRIAVRDPMQWSPVAHDHAQRPARPGHRDALARLPHDHAA